MLAIDTRPQLPNSFSDDLYASAKPSPFKDFSIRYPPPDPTDPFAPLSTLRSRRSTLQSPTPPPEFLDPDTRFQKTPTPNKHNSIDIASLNLPRPKQDPSAKKTARHTLKSYVRHEQFPVLDNFPEDTLSVVPNSERLSERRRSISTPTPVSPFLVPLPASAPPSPLKQQFDIHVERRRPATASGAVRLTTILSMVDDSVDANASGTETSESSSIGQYPFLSTEAPAPSPTNKRINFSRLLMSKKSQSSFTSTLIDVASEKKSSRSSTPLSRSIAPSIYESESQLPMPIATITAVDNRYTNRQATTEILPSLVTSKSLSSSSSDSSSLMFYALAPSPVPDAAIYRQGRKSLSNPRLVAAALQGPAPPIASPIARPHTSSGLPPRPRPFDQQLGINTNTNPPFEVAAPPTLQQLAQAASIDVIAESGVRIPFGRLFMGQKTIVCFIRHFWCSFCQDYMYSITKNIDPRVLRQAGVNLIVVSNGSYQMIKPYRQIFGMPFPVYTDPSLKLYAALGMTKRTLDAGPDSRRGSYVRHGLLSGIAMVLVNAFKVGMPFFEKAGDMSQLGGEFVLGPGLTSSFTHRMTTTRSHASILQVLKSTVNISETINIAPTQEAEMSEEERAKWMRERQKKLAQLRDRKSFRRGGEKWCERQRCELGNSSENVSEAVQPETVSPVAEKKALKKAGLNGFQPATEKTLKARKSNLDARKLRYMMRRQSRENRR